ncbi:MAG: endonuclease NucS [Acidobacteriota bacterium]|nr:endonuclease NucS [Acidobacteriota bacterium]
MPVQHAVWVAGEAPREVKTATLADEAELEAMIVAEPRILSDEWMLVGKQVNTGTSGVVDLLAIAPDASLVLIELKRDRTPRDVIAQTLDYASWLQELDAQQIRGIYSRFRPGKSLNDDFRERFGHELVEDELNNSHQLVIVASSLDARTERIVRYLEGREVPINVLFFQVFSHGNDQFLSRTWLVDPAEVQVNATASVKHAKEPWNGEFYASFGHGDHRDWDEAVEYGFISAGGGAWYSGTLKHLERNRRVWVKVPGCGFVGVGIVAGPRQAASDFEIGENPALEVLRAKYHREEADPERQEYFVPVEWLDTVGLPDAVPGMFGNQNTVCRPRTPKWRATVEELKKVFSNADGPAGRSATE